MKHSDTLAALAPALSKAQGEFEAVVKDSTNPHFRSSFASLAAVVATAAPILATNGLSVSQHPGHNEQGDDVLTTVLLHSSGEFLENTMRLHPAKKDPQGQGSALTYARRYSYMAVLGLVADDDDDGNAGSAPASRPAAKAKPAAKPAAKPKPKPAATPAADTVGTPVLARLAALYKESGWSKDALGLALVELEHPLSDNPSAALKALTIEHVIGLVDRMGGDIGVVLGTEPEGAKA